MRWRGHELFDRRVLLAFGLLLPSICAAQILVQGRVVDAASNEPLPYSMVRLVLGGTNTWTNGDGAFQVMSTIANYTLAMAYLGHATRSCRGRRSTRCSDRPQTLNCVRWR